MLPQAPNLALDDDLTALYKTPVVERAGEQILAVKGHLGKMPVLFTWIELTFLLSVVAMAG